MYLLYSRFNYSIKYANLCSRCADNGTEFKAEVLQLAAKYGINVINGAPYHLQSQGTVEVANHTFKRRLQALQTQLGTSAWAKHMTELPTAINTTRSRVS